MILKITFYVLICLDSFITLHTKDLTKIQLYRSHTPQGSDSSESMILVFDNAMSYAYFPKEFNVSNSSNTYMMIQISTNETAFSSDNALFSYFDCDPSYCTEDTSSNISYDAGWIKTNATRIYLNQPISIADGAWELKTSALYFQRPSVYYGRGTTAYGWIGLGTGSGANSNFQSDNPIFSILLNSTSDESDDPGVLMFGFNSSIADIDKPLMVVTSNQNWEMQLTSISFGSVVYSNDTNPISMTFSLESTGIYLPPEIRTSLINQMSTYNMICSIGSCACQNLTGFPPLAFGLADGSSFSLNPEDYMKPTDGFINETYMSVQFKDDLGPSHYYHDHIVLGWDILANYYSVFQQKGGINTISFYEIDSATPPDPQKNPSSNHILMIIIGVVVTILMCAGIIILGVKKGWFKKRVIKRKLIIPSELGLSNSLKEPLQSEERYCIL